MIGLGTFLSPLLRIVVIVATLASVYFFILKPILDTTENQLDKYNLPNLSTLSTDIQQAIDDAQERVNRNNAASPEAKRARKLLACMEKAGQNTKKLNRCAEKFG